MAIDDVHSIQFAGTYLGVPIAISLAYKQKVGNPPSGNPGADLLTSWMGIAGGPWRQIREDISDQLIWECGSSSYAGRVETVFFTSGAGLSAAASLPSTHCVQMNIGAMNPHPDGYEGKFYLPGWTRASVLRSGWTAARNAQLVVFAAACLSVDSLETAEPDAYRIVPHGKYLDKDLTQVDIDGALPYHSLFVKVLGNRKADNCAAFLGGGTGDFDPYDIPAEPV